MLRFRQGSYFSTDPSEAVTLYSFEGDPISLSTTAQEDGLPIFTDLGDGDVYGNTVVALSTESLYIDVALSSAAISAINAATGLFAIGFRVDSPSDNASINPLEGLNFPQLTSLQLETTAVVPLPAAFPLFAGGLGLPGLTGWRRKRKTAA